MTSKITRIERDMFEKGYVSPRMAAFKLKIHINSVVKKISRGQFESIHVGARQFIPVESIRVHYAGEASSVLGLDDWSDVFEEKDGDLHIRKV